MLRLNLTQTVKFVLFIDKIFYERAEDNRITAKEVNKNIMTMEDLSSPSLTSTLSSDGILCSVITRCTSPKGAIYAVETCWTGFGMSFYAYKLSLGLIL